MGFNWRDYLRLAEKLYTDSVGSEIEKAYLRSSISRAYYAVFCKAAKRYKMEGGIITAEDSHKNICDYYKEADDKNRRSIGVELDRLRINRKKADYDSIIKNLEKLTLLSLESAEDIYDKLLRLQ